MSPWTEKELPSGVPAVYVVGMVPSAAIPLESFGADPWAPCDVAPDASTPCTVDPPVNTPKAISPSGFNERSV